MIGKTNSTSMDKPTDGSRNDRQERFDNQQRRRLSAPDMRRRAVLNDRVQTILNQKGLSTEHINAEEMFARLNATGFRRRHGHSIGEFTAASLCAGDGRQMTLRNRILLDLHHAAIDSFVVLHL